MKKSISTLILALVTTVLFSQEFEVPQNYILKTQEDFDKYEKSIIAGFDWLMATPADASIEKRQDVGAFLMNWISGNPNLSVETQEQIVNFMEANPDLMLIFAGGWAKYVLTTHDTDKVNCNVKGIESVIDYYQKNKDKLQKDKHVEKYIKMKETGTLTDYVKKTVK